MAEVIQDFECDNEEFISRRIPTLLSMDSPKLLEFAIRYLNDTNINLNHEETILRNMLYYTIYTGAPVKFGFSSVKEGIEKIIENEHYKK